MAAIPALTVHSHRTIDSDTGQKDTLTGMLVDTISIKVTSNRVDYRGGKNQKQVMILNDKTLSLDVKAKILERAGTMSHKHPGLALHRSYVTEFHSGVAHGFDSATNASGYFIYLPTDAATLKGEYDDSSFTLELWENAADSISSTTSSNLPTYP
jgi:hypothetical protein